MNPSLTVVVLTYNEAVNLPQCLQSVERLAEHVFVVDSGSEDQTQEIARRHGATVIEHAFRNQAQQFNWALDHLPIETDWILRLDADEYLLSELSAELRVILPMLPRHITGLYMKRRVVFQGRWIRHGGYYPTWLMRVFRRGKARSELLEMDEHLVITEGETRRLRYDFVDHNRKGLAFWTCKHESYAEREARVLFRHARDDARRMGKPGRLGGDPPERTRWIKTKVYLRTPPFLRAFVYFLYRYVVRLGFLDGREGLIFHTLQGFWYRFYVDAKLLELRRGGTEK